VDLDQLRFLITCFKPRSPILSFNPEEHLYTISHLKASIANKLDHLVKLDTQLKHEGRDTGNTFHHLVNSYKQQLARPLVKSKL
jgi:hypothetical protein